MAQIAKLFTNGRSQAVRLPAHMRFDGKEVYIRQDANTGDVIISRKPPDWDSFLDVLKGVDVPPTFLDKAERHQAELERDPFADWQE